MDLNLLKLLLNPQEFLSLILSIKIRMIRFVRFIKVIRLLRLAKLKVIYDKLEELL